MSEPYLWGVEIKSLQLVILCGLVWAKVRTNKKHQTTMWKSIFHEIKTETIVLFWVKHKVS